MKIILINPASGLVKPLNRLIKFEPPVPPLGLASIAAVLRREGVSVAVLDQVANGFTNEKMLQYIIKSRPDIVAFSCLTTTMTNAAALIRDIKKKAGDIFIILGNIHPTLFPEETIRGGLADLVVRGEGEKTLVNLIKRIKRKEPYFDLKGISFKSAKSIVHNPDEEPIENLDELPFPEWSIFDLDKYSSCPMLMIKGRALTIQASRGCPYRCFFCGQETMNKKVRTKHPMRLADEIEFFHKTLGVKYFGFIDAYFPLAEQQGYDFAGELIRRGLHKKIKWFSETRVDKIDYELLAALKKSGLYLMQYGFESGNQQVLDNMNKMITLEQSRRAMAATKKAGIFSVGLFILGMPGETADTCRQTIRFARELDCDIAKFNIATPYPGSRFFAQYCDRLPKGILTSRMTSWLDWSMGQNELVYSPEGLSCRDLVNMQRRAMYDFYVRPRMIFRHLAKQTIPFSQLLFGGGLLVTKYLKSKFEN